MERNALAKFQDQRNVISFTNYLLIYFHAVNRIDYERPRLGLITFNILQVTTVSIYCNPRAKDRNQPTCHGALSRAIFPYTHSYIDRHVLCSQIRPLTKMCNIIFKNLATQGIQLTQEILYVESKTSTSRTSQAWRTAKKNV